MDAYLVRTKPLLDPPTGAALSKTKPATGALLPRPEGGTRPVGKASTKAGKAVPNVLNGGIKAANAPTLKSLTDADNPITNSLKGSRIVEMQSVASGHQTGGPGGSGWRVHRNAKLKQQATPQVARLFAGCLFYINGYSGAAITNLELIAMIQANGGDVRYTPSATCTHILTDQGLSAKKAQAFLDAKARKTKIVRPAWVIESVRAGARKAESEYKILFDETQETMRDILKASTSTSTSIASDAPPRKRTKLKHVSDYECAADVAVAVAVPRRPLPGVPVTAGVEGELKPGIELAVKTERRTRVKRDRVKKENRGGGEEMEVLIINSSPLEVRHQGGSSGGSSVPAAGSQNDEVQLMDDDDYFNEEDEWGMPPSAQRC